MKIGIITMHRVLNFGSALQAFALQKILDKNGVYNEIINYKFPPKLPILSRINTQIRYWIYLLRTGTFFEKSKKQYFSQFYKYHLRLSEKTYNKKNIVQTNNIYDAFFTGSDQVWNPRWVNDDTSFLLSFVDDVKPKFSYASSFTIDNLPDKPKKTYQKYLKRYNHITVRESSGLNIVKELTGKQAEQVLDPTLLLKKEDYQKLSMVSKLSIKESYILVYILTYMYNPFPEVNHIVNKVHEALGGNVVYLGSSKYSAYNRNCICIENIGPCEFVWLFEHASFVITSSFHGTAFANIFHKPLLATVKKYNDSDDRIPSLLKQIGSKYSIIEYNAKELNITDVNIFRCSEEMLENARTKSLQVLLNDLSLL